MNNNKTFVKITNQDIYNELQNIKTIVEETNGKVKFHHRWLWSLTGAFCTGFIFIMSVLLQK